jgi:hypothetical protein
VSAHAADPTSDEKGVDPPSVHVLLKSTCNTKGGCLNEPGSAERRRAMAVVLKEEEEQWLLSADPGS